MKAGYLITIVFAASLVLPGLRVADDNSHPLTP